MPRSEDKPFVVVGHTLFDPGFVSAAHRNRRLFAKPVTGIEMLSTSVKLKEDYITERLSTSKLSLKLVTPPLLLIIPYLPVITSNGTILRS